MKFFNLDCHIGVRDFAELSKELGHEIRLESLSDHTHLCGLSKTEKFIDYKYLWRHINPDICNDFYKKYKEELSDVSCFYCFYAPSFSLLYEKFDKPIIIHVPIRFETPFQNDTKKLEWFFSFLQRGIDEKRIYLCSNNLLDKIHIEKTIDREVNYISSYCGYNQKNCSLENEKIIFDKNRSSLNLDESLFHKFNGEYSLDEFYKFSGCVMSPYHNSTMALFERYASNMPLFLPSLKFLMDSWSKNPISVLEEISWFKIDKTYPQYIHGDQDVNLYLNKKSAEFNFSLCDWLDKKWMGNIIQFDSEDHLKNLIEETDKKSISDKMREENMTRKNIILSKWKSLFSKI
jgi:hypothetical protein